jgi:zinc and cadmium transporter
LTLLLAEAPDVLPLVRAASPQVWLQALAAVVVVSLLSLVGAVTFVVRRERLDLVLPYFVSVAVGAMLGSAFLHLIPELFPGGVQPRLSFLILVGMIVFFVLERFIHWHQHGHAEGHAAVAPYAWLNLAGDGLHNFADGIMIAAAFMTDVHLGVTTTIAVSLHEIPQELGDVSILLQGNFTRRRALLLNLATALLAVLGAVLALLLGGRIMGFKEAVLALTAGGFIYIAAADLIPELHRERRPLHSALQVGCLIAGIAVMHLLR